MGIQSTVTITRDVAIKRIREIIELVKAMNYREIENITFEDSYSVSEFVFRIREDFLIQNTDQVDMWTNKMLESVMDMPFFRRSMFNNYWVVDEQ